MGAVEDILNFFFQIGPLSAPLKTAAFIKAADRPARFAVATALGEPLPEDFFYGVSPDRRKILEDFQAGVRPFTVPGQAMAGAASFGLTQGKGIYVGQAFRTQQLADRPAIVPTGDPALYTPGFVSDLLPDVEGWGAALAGFVIVAGVAVIAFAAYKEAKEPARRKVGSLKGRAKKAKQAVVRRAKKAKRRLYGK